MGLIKIHIIHVSGIRSDSIKTLTRVQTKHKAENNPQLMASRKMVSNLVQTLNVWILAKNWSPLYPI